MRPSFELASFIRYILMQHGARVLFIDRCHIPLKRYSEPSIEVGGHLFRRQRPPDNMRHRLPYLLERRNELS